MAQTDLLDFLPPMQRLALAYAPARVRPLFLSFFALDMRLAGIVRSASEPMLGQLRLAWWRDRLAEDNARWPAGEPLLAALACWQGQHALMAPLADCWEAMLGDAPLPPSVLELHAEGRAAAMAGLAGCAGAGEAAGEVRRMARNWALADLAIHLSHPEERASALALAGAQDWSNARLPRSLRPLAVMHGLSARALRGDGAGNSASIRTILAAIRLGLLGR